MVEIRAVGFDLDGTLFDHAGAARRAVHQFAVGLVSSVPSSVDSLWLTIETEEFELWRSGQVSFAEQRRRRLQRFLPHIGASVPVDDAELDALFSGYIDAYRRAWRVFNGTIETLEELRASDIRIGVLTNGDGTQQRDKLHTLGLLPLVDEVCISGEIGFSKPDPRAFAGLVASLGVSYADVVFIGDSESHDVRAARAAGIRSGLVETGERPDRLARAIQRAHL